MTASVMSEDGVPLTARGRYAVPGYSGHIPGKAPEVSNMGQRFAVCNENGIKSLRGDLKPAAGRLFQERGGCIPGCSGHIPGKLEDTYGITWQRANRRAQTAPQTPHEVRPGAWASMPSRPLASPSPHQGPGTPRPGSGKAVAAVAGYAGHVPGKHADNVVGARFAAANVMAAVGQPDGHAWKRSEGPGVAPHRRGAGAAPGKAVPGYTGYVHGVRPEADIMGMPFKAANEHGDKVRLSLKAKEELQINDDKRGTRRKKSA